MHGEKNIGKHLIVGLIYPAVLGTVIYILIELFGKHFLNQELLKIQENSWDIILFKVVLLLATLIFYACDFLYTTYTKTFRILYFVFDLNILAGLFTTFKSVNFDNSEQPRITLILVCFSSFMVLYLILDCIEYYSKESKDTESEKMFYKKMILWESISLSFFAVILFLSWKDILNNYTVIISATIAIAVSTSIFIWLAIKKRNLYFP